MDGKETRYIVWDNNEITQLKNWIVRIYIFFCSNIALISFFIITIIPTDKSTTIQTKADDNRFVTFPWIFVGKWLISTRWEFEGVSLASHSKRLTIKLSAHQANKDIFNYLNCDKGLQILKEETYYNYSLRNFLCSSRLFLTYANMTLHILLMCSFFFVFFFNHHIYLLFAQDP